MSPWQVNAIIGQFVGVPFTLVIVASLEVEQSGQSNDETVKTAYQMDDLSFSILSIKESK